jgi:FkbM family methyltransferase
MLSMKIIIWGTGKIEKSIESYILDTVDIVAFVDNNPDEWDNCICIMRNGEVRDIGIISPKDLEQLEYDFIIIATAAYKEIEKQCVDNLKISEEKILQAYDLQSWKPGQISMIFDTNILADNENYHINGRHLMMDKDHFLPIHQRNNPMFNRFFPYLSSITREKDGNYIVDIGANIGDTLMDMWDNTEDMFLCVEPEETFLNMAQRNAKLLDDECRISFERAFITDCVEQNYKPNIYRGGTSVKERIYSSDESGIPSKTLDFLIEENNISSEDLDLIKIDTDGFDGDCILSGRGILTSGNALLYWENQISTYEQYIKYQKAYELLEKAGYTDFFVFDNFGNYMCRGGVEMLRSLADYLQRINMNWDITTFYYVDILGCKSEDVGKCKNAIDTYLKQFLLCRKKKKE